MFETIERTKIAVLTLLGIKPEQHQAALAEMPAHHQTAHELQLSRSEINRQDIQRQVEERWFERE